MLDLSYMMPEPLAFGGFQQQFRGTVEPVCGFGSLEAVPQSWLVIRFGRREVSSIVKAKISAMWYLSKPTSTTKRLTSSLLRALEQLLLRIFNKLLLIFVILLLWIFDNLLLWLFDE